MTQTTPNPETEQETQEFHFIPGELEPIKSDRASKSFKLPAFINPSLVKNAFRPMLFGALGIHGFLLFVPLTSTHQVKPKETAEPSKIKRLSDKVLVKSMPKIKVTSLPKPNLPKVAVASTNPVVIKSSTPPEPTPAEKKPDEKQPEEKKSDTPPSPSSLPPVNPSAMPPGSSDKGVDPSTLKDPSKGTTDEKQASKLDEESQKFANVIEGLRSTLNPNEASADPDMGFLKEEDQAYFFTQDGQPKAPGSYISPTNTLADVEESLTGKFDKFTKKSAYAPNGSLYEAKIGTSVRYISLVEAGGGIMVFMWDKSPV